MFGAREEEGDPVARGCNINIEPSQRPGPGREQRQEG